MVKMFGGVLVLGGIAASCVSANHAHPQMHPGVAGFDAVLANVLIGGCNFDLIQMFAFAWHVLSPTVSSSNHELEFKLVPVLHDPSAPDLLQPRSCSAENPAELHAENQPGEHHRTSVETPSSADDRRLPQA